jgi:hypothetical protein
MMTCWIGDVGPERCANELAPLLPGGDDVENCDELHPVIRTAKMQSAARNFTVRPSSGGYLSFAPGGGDS